MDSWCKPLKFNGNLIYGGAARNVRIAKAGGVQQICEDVARDAARLALERAGITDTPPRYANNVVPLRNAA